MKINLKKALLTGTAIVAVASFVPPKAYAAGNTFDLSINGGAGGTTAPTTGQTVTQQDNTTDSIWDATDGAGDGTNNIIFSTPTGNSLLTLEDSTGVGPLLVHSVAVLDDTNTSTIVIDGTTHAVEVDLSAGVSNAGAGVNDLAFTLTDGGNSATLNFDGAAAQTIHATIDGNSPGEGTLVVSNTHAGAGVTFSDAIGATNALGTIQLAPPNGTTNTFNSTVDANLIQLTNIGATAFTHGVDTNSDGTIDLNGHNSTITFSDGANFGTTVASLIEDSSTTNQGIIDFAGASTVAGSIGTAADGLGAINFNGIAGKVVTVGGTTAATTITSGAGTETFTGLVTAGAGDYHAGAGAQTFNGGLTGNLNFDLNGTATLGNATILNGNVTNTTTDQGTLNIGTAAGTEEITGTVGSTGVGLLAVNMNGTGVAQFDSTVKATTITEAGVGGTLDFQNAVTGNVVIGATGGIVTIDDHAATGISGTLTNTSGAATGTLNVGTAGADVATFGGAVGAAGVGAISTINMTGTGTAQFNGNVFATTINETGVGGTLDFKGNVTGTAISLQDVGGIAQFDGAAAQTVTSTISGNAPGTGILTVNNSFVGVGATFNGAIGGAGNTLATINLDSTATHDTSFGSTVDANTIIFGAGGTVNFAQTVNGTSGGNIDFNGNTGTINFADGAGFGAGNIVDNSTGANGTVNFAGASAVAGSLGTTLGVDGLSAVNFNGIGGKVVTVAGTTVATTITSGAGTETFTGLVTAGAGDYHAGAGAQTFNGGLTGNLNFDLNGTATLGDAQTLNGNVTNTTTNQGTLDLGGAGVGHVTGTVGSTGVGLLAVNISGGGVALLDGAVKATNINVSGTGGATFGSTTAGTVNLTGAGSTTTLDGTLTGGINFGVGASAATTAIIGDTANVTTTIDNTSGVAGNGTLTLLSAGADTTTIGGAVGGAVAAHALGLLNINGTGIDAFGSTVQATSLDYGAAGTATFAGNVNVTNFDFVGHNGVATFASGANFTGGLIDTGGGNGTVNFSGNETFGGNLGVVGTGLLAVNFNGGGGTTATVSGTTVATTITTGAGAETFNGLVTATTFNAGTGGQTFNAGLSSNLNFAADGTATVADGQTLAGNVTTAGAGTGTLDVGGAAGSTVTGTVGIGGGGNLLAVNVAGAGVSTFDLAVAATTVNVTGTGGATFDGAVTATNVNLSGAGSTSTFDGTLTGALNFSGGATAATTAIIGDTVNVVNAIDNTTGVVNRGTLTLNSAGADNTLIGGAVGGVTAAEALNTINVNGTGQTSFGSTVNASNIDYLAAGTLNFAASVTSDAIDFAGAAGTANFADGANYAGDIIDSSGTNQGTVNFAGTSNVTAIGGETGSLGTPGNGIAAVNTGGGGAGTVTVAGTIVAANIGIGGTSTLTADGNVTGAVNFGANGTFNVGPAVTTVTGNITDTGGSQGTLNIGSTAATEFTGTIGVGGGGALSAVNLTGAGGVVTFDQDVAADTFGFTAANEVARLKGNLTTATGAGTITGTGTQSFAINGNDSTITNSGAITGLAGINVNSGNTLTLAGVGAVTGGTILLNADGAALTITGAKTISSAITGTAGTQTVNAEATTTLSGTVSSAGTINVNVSGGSVLTLGGNVSGGTITLAAGATQGLTINAAGDTVSDNVVSDSTAGQVHTLTMTAGTLSGSVNMGAGDSIIAANGGTISGPVTFGDGDNTLTLGAGTITNTITFGAGTNDLNVTASNAITSALSMGSGNTSVGSLNGHTLTVSAAVTGFDATAESGLDIDGGTLAINSGGSVGGAISDSAGGGTLNFGANGTGGAFALGGVVDEAALTVTSGTLATNGFTMGATNALGNITVGVGGHTATFNVNDNVTSGGSLTLDANGTVHIGNQGLGAPGAPTLTVASIAAVPAGGDFIFDLNKTGAVLTNGSINVTGGGLSNLTNATITMNVTGQSLLNGEVFHLVTGPGGTLDLPNPAFANVDTSFVYDYALSNPAAGNMDLTVTVNPSLASDTTSSNNLKVADVLLLDLAGSTNPQIIEIQNNLANAPNKTAFNNILSSVQPTVDGSGEVAAIDISGFTFDLADQRLYSLRTGNDETGMAAGDSSQGMEAWAQAFGQHANQDERDGINGYDSNTWGGAAGFDTRNISDRFVVGIAGSYGRTTANSSNVNKTDTDVDSYQATLYGTYNIDRTTYVNGMAAYGWDKDDTTRQDVGGVAGLTAHGSFNAQQFTAQADAGRDFDVDHGTVLTPNILAHWVNYDPSSYTETGAGGADMHVDGHTENLFELGAGLNAGWTIKEDNGSLFKPELRAGYRYAVVDDRIEDTSTFTAGGGAFTTQGASPDRSRVDLGTSLKLETVNNWDLTASYDFNWRSDYTSSSGFLRAGYKF